MRVGKDGEFRFKKFHRVRRVFAILSLVVIIRVGFLLEAINDTTTTTTTTITTTTAIAAASAQEEAIIRVACVGDSLTWGAKATRGLDDYPTQLQQLLHISSSHGNITTTEHHGYLVENFGVNGACIHPSFRNPYIGTDVFRNATTFGANIVLLMLGTNDSRIPKSELEEGLATAFTALIKAFWFFSRPRIMLGIPPAFVDRPMFDQNLRNVVVPILQQASTNSTSELVQSGVPVEWVNLREEINGRNNASSFYDLDRLHLNPDGYALMANLWYQKIRCNVDGNCRQPGESCETCPEDCCPDKKKEN